MPVVCDCNHFITSKGFLHPDRLLDFHVLLYIREGAFYVTEDEIDYEITCGNAIFLKAGLRHYGKIPVPGGTEWYFIHFFLNQDSTDLPVFCPSMQPLPCNKRLEYQLPLPKMLYSLRDTELEESIMAIPQLYHSDAANRGWEINALTYRLLNQIAKSGNPNPKDTLSDSICEYLSRHKFEPFSSADLEQEFFLSYKHMASVFKKEKQMTMQQYHTTLRMQQACNLLTSTLLSVSEISAMLGFSDMLYFSRCFHQYSGQSPTVYRQTHYQTL